MKTFSSNWLPGKGIIVAISLLLLVGLHSLVAAGADSKGTSAQDPAAKKIHITARQLVSDTANNNAEFIGDVHARQGDTVITADRLKILFGGTKTQESKSPTQSLEKLVATGNVEIKFDNRLAVAQQAVYITAQRVLTLSGSPATVTSGDNTISGEKITFYRDDGRFTVDGGTNGRVKAVILPEDSGLE